MKWGTTYTTRHARIEAERQHDLFETRLAQAFLLLMILVVILGVVLWNQY